MGMRNDFPEHRVLRWRLAFRLIMLVLGSARMNERVDLELLKWDAPEFGG